MSITFGFMTPTTMVIVLIIALVIFGPGKLPDVGKALGRGIKEFKVETNGESAGKSEAKGDQSDSKTSTIS